MGWIPYCGQIEKTPYPCLLSSFSEKRHLILFEMDSIGKRTKSGEQTESLLLILAADELHQIDNGIQLFYFRIIQFVGEGVPVSFTINVKMIAGYVLRVRVSVRFGIQIEAQKYDRFLDPVLKCDFFQDISVPVNIHQKISFCEFPFSRYG